MCILHCEYLGNDGICDTKFALGFFADDEKRAVKLFQKFNSEENDAECLEYKESGRINDTERQIERLTGISFSIIRKI